jgi:hypothetical protein
MKSGKLNNVNASHFTAVPPRACVNAPCCWRIRGGGPLPVCSVCGKMCAWNCELTGCGCEARILIPALPVSLKNSARSGWGFDPRLDLLSLFGFLSLA